MKQIKSLILTIMVIAMAISCTNPMDLNLDLPAEEKGPALPIPENVLAPVGTKGLNPTLLYDAEFIRAFSNTDGNYQDVASSDTDFYFLTDSGAVQQRPHSNILQITQSRTFTQVYGKFIHIDYDDNGFGLMGITDTGFVYTNILGRIHVRAPKLLSSSSATIKSFTNRRINGNSRVIIVESVLKSGASYPTYTAREFEYDHSSEAMYNEVSSKTFGLYEGKTMAATGSYIYGYDGGGYYNDGNFWRRTALTSGATIEKKGVNTNHSYDSSAYSGESPIECSSMEFCYYKGEPGFIIYNKLTYSMEVTFLPFKAVNLSYSYQGIPRFDFSGSKGSQSYYKVWVRDDITSLKIILTGYSNTTGDADAYIKFDSTPTTSSYDKRLYRSGNNDSQTITNPGNGLYYIMVKGYSAFSHVNLDFEVQN